MGLQLRSLALGTASGFFGAIVLVTFMYYWIFSPERELRQASGLVLPSTARLVWERDEHGVFLGQGFTLRVFSISAGTGHSPTITCPQDFSQMRLDESGIWSKLEGLGLDGMAPACVLRSESPSRQDVVVVLSDQVFHLSIDR